MRIEWLAERQRRHRCGKGQERAVQPLHRLNLKHTGPLGWRREWSADGHSLCLWYGPARFCLPNPFLTDGASPEELLFRSPRLCTTVSRCGAHEREIRGDGKTLKRAIHRGLYRALNGGELSRGKGILCVMRCLLEVLHQRIIQVGVGLHRLFLKVLSR